MRWLRNRKRKSNLSKIKIGRDNIAVALRRIVESYTVDTGIAGDYSVLYEQHYIARAKHLLCTEVLPYVPFGLQSDIVVDRVYCHAGSFVSIVVFRGVHRVLVGTWLYDGVTFTERLSVTSQGKNIEWPGEFGGVPRYIVERGAHCHGYENVYDAIHDALDGTAEN